MKVSLVVFAALVAVGSCRDTVVSTSGFIHDQTIYPQYQQSSYVATLNADGVTWSPKGSVVQTRSGGAHGTFNDGLMFAAGGVISGDTSNSKAVQNSAETYTLGSNGQVTAGAVASVPSNLVAVESIGVTVGDKLYALTAVTVSGQTEPLYNKIAIYNRLSNSWSTSVTLPNGHGTGAAVAYDQYIYFFDGRGSNGGRVDRFNTQTKTTTTVAVRPFPVGQNFFGSSAVRLGEFIYLIGGAIPYDNTDYPYVFKFNPRDNTFQQVADLNIARLGAGVTVANGLIYVVGGSLQRSQEVYDPATGIWTLQQSQVYPDSVYGLAGEGLYTVTSPRTLVNVQQFATASSDNCATVVGDSNTFPINQCFAFGSTYSAKLIPGSTYSTLTLTIYRDAMCKNNLVRTQQVETNQCTKVSGFNFVLSYHE